MYEVRGPIHKLGLAFMLSCLFVETLGSQICDESMVVTVDQITFLPKLLATTLMTSELNYQISEQLINISARH